jgi:hypothetical protein
MQELVKPNNLILYKFLQISTAYHHYYYYRYSMAEQA